MNYNQLIQLFFERSNALQWYWTLYVVIVGGLMAFSSLRQRGDLVTTILITVLFAFFAYKNLGAIHDTTFQRYAALSAVKACPNPDGLDAEHRKALEETLVTPDWPGVRNFHIMSDILTVAVLWAMERRRRRYAASTTQTPVIA